MALRAISDNQFYIHLYLSYLGGIYNTHDAKCHHIRSEVIGGLWEERYRVANEPITALFLLDGRLYHRGSCGGLCVCVQEPGMKGHLGYFYRQAEKEAQPEHQLPAIANWDG
jgi:hypothetical protein